MFGLRVETAAQDDDLRAVVLEGAGPDFCAGVDWVATNEAGARPRPGHLVRRVPLQAHRIIELVHGLEVPVVSIVRGWASPKRCAIASCAMASSGIASTLRSSATSQIPRFCAARTLRG